MSREPRKAVERAIALGDIDPFDFVLARDLGLTLTELHRLGQAEIVQWRAFYVWEQAMNDFKARVHAKRRHA